MQQVQTGNKSVILHTAVYNECSTSIQVQGKLNRFMKVNAIEVMPDSEGLNQKWLEA